MFSSKKLNITSIVLAVAALAVGLASLIWYLILDNHNWNHGIFRQNYHTDAILGELSIAIVSLVVLWGCFYFLKRKITNKICKILSYITYTLYNIATIAIIIISLCASLDFGRDYNNYKLDNQLSSNDIVKFHEAIDYIIARLHNDYSYNGDKVNYYMMKAARDGYAPAQNYVGGFFHEQAKKQNDKHFGHDKWDCNETSFCQENLTRATYWWLKAANQNYGKAQENLGRMKMKSILSNQPYSFGEARFWLTEAAKNGVVSAYYYLGLLCKDICVADAVQYWRMGAEKGNEDCNRMLENPDFIDVTVNRQN